MSRSRKKKPPGGSEAPTPAPQGKPDAPVGWLASKWPIIKAVSVFGVVMGGFYVGQFYYTGKIDWYLQWIANVCAAVLHGLGQETEAFGTSIVSSTFSVKIVHGCDALEPTAAFVAAVLASPVAFGRKLPGLAIGIIALMVINLFRIVSLFFVGRYYYSMFEMVHMEFWQAVFIVLAIVFWAVWVQWATRKRPVAANA